MDLETSLKCWLQLLSHWRSLDFLTSWAVFSQVYLLEKAPEIKEIARGKGASEGLRFDGRMSRMVLWFSGRGSVTDSDVHFIDVPSQFSQQPTGGQEGLAFSFHKGENRLRRWTTCIRSHHQEAAEPEFEASFILLTLCKDTHCWHLGLCCVFPAFIPSRVLVFVFMF